MAIGFVILGISLVSLKAYENSFHNHIYSLGLQNLVLLIITPYTKSNPSITNLSRKCHANGKTKPNRIIKVIYSQVEIRQITHDSHDTNY